LLRLCKVGGDLDLDANIRIAGDMAVIICGGGAEQVWQQRDGAAADLDMIGVLELIGVLQPSARIAGLEIIGELDGAVAAGWEVGQDEDGEAHQEASEACFHAGLLGITIGKETAWSDGRARCKLALTMCCLAIFQADSLDGNLRCQDHRELMCRLRALPGLCTLSRVRDAHFGCLGAQTSYSRMLIALILSKRDAGLKTVLG
jgi:hypothetical protein